MIDLCSVWFSDFTKAVSAKIQVRSTIGWSSSPLIGSWNWQGKHIVFSTQLNIQKPFPEQSSSQAKIRVKFPQLWSLALTMWCLYMGVAPPGCGQMATAQNFLWLEWWVQSLKLRIECRENQAEPKELWKSLPTQLTTKIPYAKDST